MRLCHIVPSLEARYGGPSKSVHSISNALATEGHIVELLSTAPNPVAPSTDGRLTIEIFRRDSPQFLCPSHELKQRLEKLDVEIVHNHGLWLRPLGYAKSISVKKKTPLVVAPRGMMGPWAWNHHRLRKWLCTLFVHPGAFETVRGWHATSGAEADDIRRLGFKAPICIAPNGVSAPTLEAIDEGSRLWFEKVPDAKNRPVALFYSRFHSKKRVKELIQLWTERKTSDWLLLIVGIPEEFSKADLSAYVESLNASNNIRVFSGTGLPPPYPIASIFILPSHNENFGMSIAEAMAHEVPVLVTDATPWKRLEEQRLGWCVPWKAFGETLEMALAEGPTLLKARGKSAKSWVLSEFSWARSANILSDFYQTLRSQ